MADLVNQVAQKTTGASAVPNATSESEFMAVIFPPNYKRNYAFRGKVKSFSSQNSEGPFDILPEHENFVTMAHDKITMVDLEGKKIEIVIEKAVLEASNNLVKVFIEF